MKKLYKNLLIATTFLASASVYGQVGFNNPNPDPSSILDLTANDKGLLVPRMTTAQRSAIGGPAEGLLVYQTDGSKGFYYHDGTGWYTVGGWVKTTGSTNVTLPGSAVVSGTITSNGLTNSGTLSTNTLSSTTISNSGSITTNSLSSTGSVSAGSLSVPGFPTNALVPSGVIVMWSGSVASIPSGWALCNGASGTPDLRDRFVVGAGSSYSPGNTGGANTVTLNVNQIPSHNHTYTDVFYSEANAFRPAGTTAVAVPANVGSGGSDSDNTGYGVTRTSNNTGASQSHENRPLYWALAYIMKL